ncbi:RHS repeat-associated core domain-containing protein, partial [Thermogutta sp.]|uniref:RHS repeat-associated core domain-containing protein n=1 Tax=Thermogutta sp. TaxID=1962930 RepID=UPI00321FC5D3
THTRLVRFGARDYDAQVGRWTARDPIKLNGGPNVYAHSMGDFVNFADPDGLQLVVYPPVPLDCLMRPVPPCCEASPWRPCGYWAAPGGKTVGYWVLWYIQILEQVGPVAGAREWQSAEWPICLCWYRRAGGVREVVYRYRYCRTLFCRESCGAPAGFSGEQCYLEVSRRQPFPEIGPPEVRVEKGFWNASTGMCTCREPEN